MMALSGPEWVGRVLVDRDGAQIGACTAVLADETEGVPQWLGVELGRTVWIPASGAAEVADRVQVTVSQAEVASAPIAGDGPPSKKEKVALSRHYRVGPVKAEARRRRQLLVAGVLAGVAAVAGAVLARRHLRVGQPRNAGELLLRGARGVVSAAPVMTAPAAVLVANMATRSARLAAAGSKRGVATGATVARAGSAAARGAGIRAAQVTAAVRAVAAEARDSGVRGGKRVGASIESVPETVSERSEQLQKRWRKVMGKFTAALTLGVGVCPRQPCRTPAVRPAQAVSGEAGATAAGAAGARAGASGGGREAAEAIRTKQAAHGERQAAGDRAQGEGTPSRREQAGAAEGQ